MRQTRRRRNRNLGSSLIFAALAFVLGVIAVYVYLENDDESPPTGPTPDPIAEGRYELQNVLSALAAQEIDAAFVRSSARSDQLSNPGQPISIGDATLYVFLYGSVPEREADSDGLDLESLVLTALGTPVPGDAGPPLVIVLGNLIAVLPSGDAELREKVEAAMASLPDIPDTDGTSEAAWNRGSVVGS